MFIIPVTNNGFSGFLLTHLFEKAGHICQQAVRLNTFFMCCPFTTPFTHINLHIHLHISTKTLKDRTVAYLFDSLSMLNSFSFICRREIEEIETHRTIRISI